MKINELSNPTYISSKFELVNSTPAERVYRNIATGIILKCYISDHQYLFTYDGEFDIQKHNDATLSLAIFKTVLYDVKTNIVGKACPYFYFVASRNEPSRIKLYTVMVNLLQKFDYFRINSSDELRKYVVDDDSWYAGLRIFARSRAMGRELYMMAKNNEKDSSTISLTELRNPSKPSDKFKLTYSHEFTNLSQYTYYSTNADRHGDNYILDLTFLGSENTEIYFDLNGTQAQSPEYAHMAMAVFQTVIHKINEYVTKHTPKTIKFSSSITEPTRIKLYHRICNNMPGYEMTEIDGYFTLTKQ